MAGDYDIVPAAEIIQNVSKLYVVTSGGYF
jgi:hypothetical protein